MLKAAVYKTTIRHVTMYGSETWTLRKAEQNLLERTEMRKLKWMMRGRHENMEDGSGWTPKYMNPETELV